MKMTVAGWQSQSERRRGLAAAMVLLWVSTGAWGQEPAASLASYAPRETKFFGEVRYLGQLREMLTASGAWDALTYLVSQSGPEGAGADDWSRQVESVLGMKLTEAIGTLFGEQVAVAAPDWNRLKTGVVLARVTDAEQFNRLIQRHGPAPKQKDGDVTIHQLTNSLCLATNGTIAVFGSPQAEGLFFEQSVALLSGRGMSKLANSPSFVEQLSELPPEHLGLLYIETPDGTPGGSGKDKLGTDAGLPGWWPATWPLLRRSAAGMYAKEDGRGLDLVLRGLLSSPQTGRVTGGVSPALLRRLPRSTLAAWCFPLDYLSAYNRALRPQNNKPADIKRLLLELARTWMVNQNLEEMLIRHLDQDTIVVLGQQPAPVEELGERFDRPMLSVMVKVKNSDAVAAAVGELMTTLVNLQNLQNAAQNAAKNLQQSEKAAPVPLLKIIPEKYKGVNLWRVPWGEVLRVSHECPFLSTLQISWTVFDGWLIVSSDVAHVRQLIDAQQAEDDSGFAGTAAFQSLNQDETGQLSVAVFQPAQGARLIESWMNYFQRSHPELLKPNWWQRKSQGDRVELGIGIRKDPGEDGVLVVERVLEGAPAFGQLVPGDRIEAIDGRTLDLRDPLASYRSLVAGRKSPDEVLVRIRRGPGRRIELPIRLPGTRQDRSAFDPIRALRDLMVIGQPFSAWGYSLSGREPEKFDARMILRFEPRGPQGAVGAKPEAGRSAHPSERPLDSANSHTGEAGAKSAN